MTTKQALKLAAVSILASLASVGAHAYAPSDDGLHRQIGIINDSPYAIVKLEAKNVGGGSWHTYLNRVRPGWSSFAEIDDGLGYCRFDLHAVFADGSEAYADDVNVCERSAVSFADSDY